MKRLLTLASLLAVLTGCTLLSSCAYPATSTVKAPTLTSYGPYATGMYSTGAIRATCDLYNAPIGL